MLPDNFGALLVFIGSNAFVGILVSKVLENQRFFQNLSAQGKTNFVMAVHLVLGLISFFLVNHVSPDFIAQVQPVYAIVASILSQYLSATEYHDAVTVKRETPSSKTSVDESIKSDSEGAAPAVANKGVG